MPNLPDSPAFALPALLKAGAATSAELIDPGAVRGLRRDPDIILSVPVRFFTLEGQAAANEKKFTAFRRLEIGAPGEAYNMVADMAPINLNGSFSCLGDLRIALAPAVVVGVLPADSRGAATGLTHEALHALQCRVHTLDRLLLSGPGKEETWGSSVRYGHGPELEAILAAEETPEETAARHDKLRHIASGKNGEEPEVYGLQYAEIQACLHQLVHASASGWKALPATPEEARAAFEGPLSGRPAHPDYPLATEENCAAAEALYELKESAAAKLSPAQRERFFAEALPAVYGDLLEFYGDPEGRTKMGLEPSPVHGRALLQRIAQEWLQPVSDRWPKERWQALAAKAEPETRPLLTRLAAECRGLDAAREAMEATAPPRRERIELPRLEPQALAGVVFDRPGQAAEAGDALSLVR